MAQRTDDLALQLHDGLITFQRKRRIISTNRGASAEEAGPQLGYVEESVIQIIKGQPGKSIKELAELVSLERSWMSRVVSSLEERKFVTLKADPEDRRSKLVSPTPAGIAAHDALNDFASEVMDEALADLSKSERQALTRQLSAICAGMGAPEPTSQPTADPTDVQLARLSRQAGVYSSNMFGSGLNVTQIQVLALLSEAEAGSVVVKDLDSLLPFDMSTISRTVAAFEQDGLVSKEQSAEDRRSFLLTLTKKGRESVAEYRRAAQKAFAPAVKAVSKEGILEAVRLLAKATNRMPRAVRGRDGNELLVRSSTGVAKASRVSESDVVSYHFTIEKNQSRVADVRLVRDRDSRVPLELTVTGPFNSRDELNAVLQAVAAQL